MFYITNEIKGITIFQIKESFIQTCSPIEYCVTEGILFHVGFGVSTTFHQSEIIYCSHHQFRKNRQAPEFVQTQGNKTSSLKLP